MKRLLATFVTNKLLCCVILAGWVHAASGALPQFKLQILHASDLEGGVSAVTDAPNFAAVVEALERQASVQHGGTPSVLLSAGDNYLSGPFFSAAADDGLRQVLKTATQDLFETEALTDIREGAGRVDITIMNILGFDASVLGNHEFDPGTSILREIISVDTRGLDPSGFRWMGAQFPYLSANLDFSEDGNLKDIATRRILPSTDFRSIWSQGIMLWSKPKIAPATIIDITWAGRVERIGVIGATTPLLRSISFPGSTKVKGRDLSGDDMDELAMLLQPVIDDVADGEDNVRHTMDDINKIILVSHLQQIARERKLITLLSGVDIVVAGGSGTLLASSGDPLRAGDTARGPYPIASVNRDGDTALVVSTPGQYQYVGRLIAEFDSQGRLINQGSPADTLENGVYATDDAGVIRLWGDSSTPFKPGTLGAKVKSLTDAVSRVVIAKDSNVIGRTQVFLEGRRRFVRTEETNLGNLSADANLFMAKKTESNSQSETDGGGSPGLKPPLVSIRNGGGIRSEIGAMDRENGSLLPPLPNPMSNKKAGEISQLDIENTLRFNNGLTLLTVTVQGLKRILEYAVAVSAPGKTPGRFPQVSGMAFSFDPNRSPIEFDNAGNVIAEGSRVRSVVVISEDLCDVIVRAGQLVGDPDQPIRLVTLNFMADGGDGYPFPRFGRDRRDLLEDESTRSGKATFAPNGSEQDALAEYLATQFSNSPLDATETPIHEDQRIQNVAHGSDGVFELDACTSVRDQVFMF